MWRYVKAAFIAGIIVAIFTICYLMSWVIVPLLVGVAVFAIIVEDQNSRKNNTGNK